MQFCPNCDNAFVITRINQNEQQAQQVQQQSRNVLRQSKHLNENDDLESASASVSVSESSDLIKLDKMDGGAIINKQDKKSEMYYFKCTNCGYIVPIEENTLIIRRTNEENTGNINQTKYADMINDVTLPHTRNYICPNKSCKSLTDHSLRDAIWFKPDRNSYMIKYVCTACKTVW